jgi:GNAT superfamily N-acetyltransferase
VPEPHDDTGPEVTLRAASPDEADEVAAVICASRAAFLAFAPMAHTPAEVSSWVASTLLPAGGVHVAECEGRLVGVLAVSRDASCSWVDQLYLLPGHTGAGIGTRLLQRAHTLLPPPIRLYTFQANAGARRFYERHGYRAVAFSDGTTNEERCPDVLYESVLPSGVPPRHPTD